MEPRDVSCTPPPGGDFSEWRLVRRAAHEAAGGGLQYLSNLHFDAASATAAKESVGGGRSPHKNDGPARWARASNYPRPPPRRLLEERGRPVNPATRTTSSRLCRAHSEPKTFALVDRHKGGGPSQQRAVYLATSIPLGGSRSRRLLRDAERLWRLCVCSLLSASRISLSPSHNLAARVQPRLRQGRLVPAPATAQGPSLAIRVSCVLRCLIEFSVLPHQKAAGIRAKAPLTLVLQSNVRMFVVLHVKGLKELAKALDGRITFHRPPAIDCTMRHSRLMFGVARMEGACHPCLGRVWTVSGPCLGLVCWHGGMRQCA